MAGGPLDFRSVEGALLRYRIVAIIVSILLVVLFGVGLPLHFDGHHEAVDRIVGVVHGAFFFPIYILLTLDLTRRVRMTPVQLVLTVAAGAVPVGSFYAERYTTRYVRQRQAALTGAPEASADVSG
jgi:integral membrane protein